MNIAQLQTFLGWNILIHLGLLCLVFLFITWGRNWLMKLHHSMFGLPEEQLLKIYLYFIATYKLLIITFLLVPYLVIRFLL